MQVLRRTTQPPQSKPGRADVLPRCAKIIADVLINLHMLKLIMDTVLMGMCDADCVFEDAHEKAKDAVLELISRERDGEQINRNLIKNVLVIFVDVGMDKGTEVYEHKFQVPLLEDIQRHYSAKAAEWIQLESCSEYLIKTETSLEAEEDRAAYYLHFISKTPVLEAVQAELLRKKQTELIEKDTGCRAMLQDSKTDDLRRMFKLFHKCGAACITPLADIFRKHIEEEGLALLSQVKSAVDAGAESGAGAASRKEAANAEQQFIRNILALQV